MIDTEVFLFGGMPERPNPVYGRDSHANVHCRMTRSTVEPQLTGVSRDPENARQEEIVLQEITVDVEAGTIEFGPFLPSKKN